MKFDSFLENVYFGRLKWEQFRYTETDPRDPVVTGIVEQIREASRDYPPERLEALAVVPDELLARLRSTGFFGLFIPRDLGGLGLSLHQFLAVVHEVVKIDMNLAILALAHLSIGMKAILLYGTADQKQRYLPRAASGDLIFAYALTEPLFGSDAKNLDTTAELADDGTYVLNGTKTFITNASYAGAFTVFAQMDRNNKGKLGAFIVESAWDGVSVGQNMAKMGLIASSTASIHLKNVRVPAGNLVGQAGDGFKIAMTVLNYGRLALGAASAGLLEISFADMLHRARSRHQFGRQILDFELIQEKLTTAFVERETIWAMTNFTAGLLTHDMTANVAIETAHTKFYGTNMAWNSLYDAMQTAGGAGYLKTQPYEKRMRDFRVTTIFEGTSEIHSIYPPLSLLREMIKHLGNRSRLGRGLAFLSLRLAPTRWSAAQPDPLVGHSLRQVKSLARRYRRLFLSAVNRYGKDLPEHEFLLRRLTRISCLLFALLAMAAKIRDQGAHFPDTRRALAQYLAAADLAPDRRLKPNRAERGQSELVDYFRTLP